MIVDNSNRLIFNKSLENNNRIVVINKQYIKKKLEAYFKCTPFLTAIFVIRDLSTFAFDAICGFNSTCKAGMENVIQLSLLHGYIQ